MAQPQYKRVLLKLSGEALSGGSSSGIDPSVLEAIAHSVGQVKALGVQLAIVIGGGNLFRGETLSKSGLSRITGDHMGMLATLMNALAMRDVFERFDLSCVIHSAIPMSGVVDHFDRRKASQELEAGRVVIFAGGTGNPLVTTDTAASLRAIEIGAELLLKATQVDGIYSADPKTHPEATRYERLSFEEVLDQELGVMDLSSFCQCRDMGMPIRIFDINHPDALPNIMLGEEIGTLVS